MAYIIEGENNVSQRLDLIFLNTRPRERPCTKARQVRQTWATELLSVGHSLNAFCGWLNEIELQIKARVSHYIGKLPRRNGAAQSRIRRRSRGRPGKMRKAVRPVALATAGHCQHHALPSQRAWNPRRSVGGPAPKMNG